MPCYTIQLVSVKFKVKHKDILEAAAKQLGFTFRDYGQTVNAGSIQIDMERGEALIERYQTDALNKLKQAYTEQGLRKVQSTARGFKLWEKKTKAKDVAKAFTLQRF